MRDTGGELTERGELLRLDQAVLRGAQILQRCGKFARAGLDAFEQAHILDCNRGLVSEGRDQLDLLISKWSYFGAGQNEDADWNPLAQHRNAENRAVIAQSLRLGPRIFRISQHIGDMNHPTFKQRTAGRIPSFGFDRNVFHIIHKFAGEAVGLRAIENSIFLARNGRAVGIAEARR